MCAHAIRRELLDDDDDDDDFEPSTPNTIRHRHVTLSQQPPRAKKPIQKYSGSQPCHNQNQSKKQGSQQSMSMRPPLSTLSIKATPAIAWTSTGASQSAGSGPSLKRKNGVSLSLKKPALTLRSVDNASNTSSTQGTSNPFLSPSPRPSSTPSRKLVEETLIVLDSESEGNSDAEVPPTRSVSNEVPVSKSLQEQQHFGGVTQFSPKVQHKQPDKAPDDAPEAMETKEDPVKYTQESITSSQGSVDYSRDQAHHDHNFSTVPEDNNNDEYSNENAGEDDVDHYNARWSMSPEISNPFLSDLVATPSHPAASSTISVASNHYNDGSFTMSTFHDVFTPRDAQAEDETTECVICGKDLSHLDSGRIAFHINNCIDEQQEEQTAIQSLDLDSSVQPSASQGEFAGARIDYLARVKKCPICKQDWPLKAQSRKARQKVEHLKRCAKVHKKSVQSLLYQMRLLKEKYERSLALGTPMESDPVEASQEAAKPADQNEEAVQGSAQDQAGRCSAPSMPKPIPKPKPTTVPKQVVSLTDTADADFTSDAIITTVHAPVPTRPKQSKMTRLLEDQNDESLQLALAISMSMEGPDGGSSSASRAGSPAAGSGSAAKWVLMPKSKGTNKRRKRSEREMNETTILPYAEIQNLIQANVTALLFPEDEAETEVKESLEAGREPKIHRGLQTPPWRPSRFASGSSSRPLGTSELDVNLSQSSDVSQTSPKSLWSLSHLKDTDNISTLSLNGLNKERQEAQVEEGHRSGSEEPAPGSPSTRLDRDQYVTRFMKEYLQREKDDRQSMSRTSSSASTSTSRDSNVVLDEEPCGQDNKYMSPLWSVANQRRTSMLEENRQKEQKAAQILESEIRQHLDGLEEQVQRAKKEAHAKILSSLEKYNEQVRRPKIPSPAKHILVSEDEGDHKDVDNRSNHDDQEQNMDMEDIVNTQDTLDLDDYPRPSSPLLRFSRRADGVKDAAGSPNHVIELHSDPPVSDHYSYDYNEDISFDNNYSPNNNCLSPRKNNYSPCDNDYKSNPLPDGSPTLELDRSMELHQVDDLVDVDNGGVLVYSPPVSPQFGTTRVPPRTQHQLDQSDTSFSSPPQLPPPLDFAKLGFPGAANLVQVPMDEPDLTPPPPDTWSILSPGLISRRLDRMRTIGSSNGSLNDVDDFPEDDLQASDDTSRWRNVSTPKRKAHSRSRDTALANGHDQDDRDEVGDSEDIPTRVPRRPKSATKTRSIAPFRRVTAAVTLYGMAFMNRANQFSASQSQSQLEDTTAASAPPSSSQAGVATPSRKKNKTGLDVRVEAMARESARLANNFRKQHEVPDYQSMTVAQLRKVAETFGLKSMRKNVLVEQLTAIWHRLNPDPKPRTEPEPEPVEDEQDQDRDQDGDGGIHVVDGTFAESSFGPSQGHRCVGKGKGRADDYEPTRSSRRYDASTIFSSDLDEDGEGSGGSESDLDDESDDEEEEDEDMDLDPENEGEGSIERTARGGFGGGGPDDNDDLDDLGKEDPEDREKASPTLERRLLQFLNSRPRFRKHLLMYKPLDLEVVWAECDAAGIECTRKELRQFLDRRGIICIVPADSVVGSWRKTRAKRQKRR